jgi:hypothetical protein
VNYDLPFTEYNSSELVQTKPTKEICKAAMQKKIGNSVRLNNQILLDSREEKKKTSD